MQHLRIPILAALALALATPAQAKRLNKDEKETVAVDRELVAVMQTRDRGELSEAIEKYGPPEIMNTDQGSQFTSDGFTGTLIGDDVGVC